MLISLPFIPLPSFALPSLWITNDILWACVHASFVHTIISSHFPHSEAQSILDVVLIYVVVYQKTDDQVARSNISLIHRLPFDLIDPACCMYKYIISLIFAWVFVLFVSFSRLISFSIFFPFSTSSFPSYSLSLFPLSFYLSLFFFFFQTAKEDASSISYLIYRLYHLQVNL